MGAAVLALMAGGAASAGAQGLTGQIGGTVVDSSNAAIPGALVTVRNTATQVTREAPTDATGVFVVTNLLAGTYDLRVTLSGFKTYEQRGIIVTATERVALPAIVLEVGGFEETITVSAAAALVQTQDGARSAVVTSEQIADLGLKGRDFLGSLQLLPGVVDTRNREAPGWNTLGGISVNGRSGINLTYDGIKNQDTGTASNGPYASPGLDAIAEIKVQTSNFQAEYGRSAGGSINVVTKSGSSQYRGTLAYYKRHESLNSRDWARRRQCDAGQASSCAKPPYRYDNTAWTLGGPVPFLGEFNADRDKLFFFYSMDLLPRTDPGSLQTRTMPTALERTGDFSQTVDTQGRRIWIRDPLLAGTCHQTNGGSACFADNKIPATRINPVGQQLLNMLPLPNATDPTGNRQYNHTFQNTTEQPRRDQIFRVDWNVRPGTTFYSRWQFGYEARKGLSATLGATNGWAQYPTKYEIPTWGMVNTLLHTFNPTTVLEITIGVNASQQLTAPYTDKYPDARDRNNRDLVLPDFPQFFPQANPLRVIPQVTFAGTNALPSTGQFGVEQRFPFTAGNDIWNYNVNLSKVRGSHNLKAGLYVDFTSRPASRSTPFNGTVSFNGDNNNPLNSNLGLANALLGVITQYQEADAHPSANGRFRQVEWFVQDNWRVRRNLTLDLGVRFYLIGPTFTKGQPVATFKPSLWDAADAPLLYQPTCANDAATCSGNARRALNPVTGAVLPAAYIGRLVPGTGEAYNGMFVHENGTPFEWSSVLFGPRVGLAWDVMGDGQTSIRGGAGVFYDRGYGDDTVLGLVQNPPLVNTYVVNYTTVPELLSAELTQTPTGGNAFIEGDPYRAPRIYNWSLGVQRAIGFDSVIDLAYVGNTGRNLSTGVQINGRPYGYTLRPENADRTNVQGGVARPLADDFLRPMQGRGGTSVREYHGEDLFHSFQISLNRRAVNGLGFGISYTSAVRWNIGTKDPFVSEAENRARFWSRDDNSRPHNLTINYQYDVPNLSNKWDHLIARILFDNWQVSGVTNALTGTREPIEVAFDGVPNNVIISNGSIGGSFGMRGELVCDPNLPRGERSFARQFRTECVRPPSDSMFFGTMMGDELVGIGYTNTDLSFFKNIPMTGRRTLQLRIELYNAFNTVQYSGWDTDAEFDWAAWQEGEVVQTNPAFGQVTSSREARRMQLAIRFGF
jgi:hypothetical protein